MQQATRKSGGIAIRRLAGLGTPEVAESSITELALALGVSERAATDYIAVGLDLRYRLRCTNNDFGGGRLSYAHAKVISEATRPLDDDVTERLEAQLADAAATRSPARLRILARRLAAKADPASLARRHDQAYAERSATMFALGDGIAAFSINHQLETMAVIDDQTNAWAHRRRLADPTTSFTAHKADAAALLLLGRHPLTGANLLASANDTPDTNHTTAAEAHPAPVGVVAAPSDHLPARTELRVTMSADTLLGLDDDTCELDGYGPITAEQARRLALRSASTTLRRVFTDPIDNSIITLDAHTYRFTHRQAEAIRTLHPISAFPGATTPAAHCDLDHRVPYRHAPPAPPGRPQPPDPPGQTTVTNGQPLGRPHHRIRTHTGWSAKVDPTTRTPSTGPAHMDATTPSTTRTVPDPQPGQACQERVGRTRDATTMDASITNADRAKMTRNKSVGSRVSRHNA
ncbi:MAG: DUF222 domain-containing protein [Nocardioidaceae bacterium]